MTSLYLIETKLSQNKIKLTYLHYPTDTVTISLDYNFNSTKDQIENLLKLHGFRIKGYGWNDKNNSYIFIVDNYEPLRELKTSNKRQTKKRY